MIEIGVKEDIIDRLIDLRQQAITDKSHFYVKSVVEDAMVEIAKLRRLLGLKPGQEQG